MAAFTLMIAALVFVLRFEILSYAAANVWMNGIIIGTTLFGIAICFIEMFRLLPEYKWMRGFFNAEVPRRGRGMTAGTDLPPRLLRPLAIVLSRSDNAMRATTLKSLTDIVAARMDDSGEQIRYIVNVLVFLGLMGTFIGLVKMVGGFSEMLSWLTFADGDILESVRDGMAAPMSGMATAFTSSLLGLGGSLIVGFLSLQVHLAQSAIYCELEENLASRTYI
jgi:hypothetical protein